MDTTSKINHELFAKGSTGSAGSVFDFGFQGERKSECERLSPLIHIPPLLFPRFLDTLKAQNKRPRGACPLKT